MRRSRLQLFVCAIALSIATLGVGLGARKALRAEPRASQMLPVPRATDGEIAVTNLASQLHSYDARLATMPTDWTLRRSLIDLLLAEGDVLGRVSDYERAEALAEEGVRQRPEDPSAFRARAHVRGVFHRFADAAADLDRAETLGAPPASLAPARATLLAARGDLDGALAILPKEEPSLNAMELAALGLLYGELGRVSDSERVLAAARARYTDVSPFALAWIDYSEGDLAERRGDVKRAIELFARAHALLPRYAAPVAHLAPHLPAQEALDMLAKVRERSDDPEVDAVTADSLHFLGRDAEARAVRDHAAARYDAIVRAHPEAYADHAARFWLRTDAEKAHALAQTNLAARETETSIDLALTTALVTHRDAEGCELAARGAALPHATPTFRTITTSLVSRCSVEARR